MSSKNLSAVVDFLEDTNNPEYRTTKEIVDDVWGVVSVGLEIANLFTGGFYSTVVNKIKPDKLIDKLPDEYNHMNASREKIALYYFDKNILANFMIIWITVDEYIYCSKR